MLNYYIMGLKKYYLFQGRSRRSEYWYFFLANLILGLLAGLIDGFSGLADASGNGPIGVVCSLVHFIPSISTGVRRMHDINKSGWWLLVPIYSLFLLAKDGDLGMNDHGDDPKNPMHNIAEEFS
jgi:uncharacterized membrane protein YhaH (DUF805 family)